MTSITSSRVWSVIRPQFSRSRCAYISGRCCKRYSSGGYARARKCANSSESWSETLCSTRTRPPHMMRRSSLSLLRSASSRTDQPRDVGQSDSEPMSTKRPGAPGIMTSASPARASLDRRAARSRAARSRSADAREAEEVPPDVRPAGPAALRAPGKARARAARRLEVLQVPRRGGALPHSPIPAPTRWYPRRWEDDRRGAPADGRWHALGHPE